MRPIEHPDVPYALYECTPGGLCEPCKQRIALVAIADAGFNFHKLMRSQRGFELARNARRQPRSADHHDRIAAMSKAAQVLLLFFGQFDRHV